jgi:GNAT superfamily N-acetyltransferase
VGSEISISLRGFDDSIDQAYRTLFPKDPDKSARLLNWRFRSNPHGQTQFAVAADGGRIVGMIALIPTRLRNAPGKGLGYQAVDTAVHPAYRGHGLFVKMGLLAQDPAALGGDILSLCSRAGSKRRAALPGLRTSGLRRLPADRMGRPR